MEESIPHGKPDGTRKETVMSINVYLKEGIRNQLGFKSQEKDNSGKYGGTYTELTFEGIKLQEGEGRLYLGLQGLDSKIPEKLRSWVDDISFVDGFSCKRGRQPGIYRKGELVAELEAQSSPTYYSVKMRGRMEDMPTMLELYRAIRAGTISPLPGDSWEDGQLRRPLADIEQDLVVALAQRNELQAALVKAQYHIEWLTTERQKYSNWFDLAMQALHLVDIRLRNSRVIWGRSLRDLVGEKIAAIQSNPDIINPGN
jgi:hypothetical protein